MKRMTKILLIVAAVMVGLGIVLSAIGVAINGGVTSARMVMNPFGNIHWWFDDDEEDIFDDETDGHTKIIEIPGRPTVLPPQHIRDSKV